jgi:hypothetical protein
MRTIFKYPLVVKSFQTLSIPYGAKLLTVQVQRDIPCLWAEIDSEKVSEFRSIEIFGTGHPIPEGNRIYIGSFQLEGGNFIGHCYERIAT